MATYNIEMNTLNSSGSYDQLYPQTYLSNVKDYTPLNIKAELVGSLLVPGNTISIAYNFLNDSNVRSCNYQGVVIITNLTSGVIYFGESITEPNFGEHDFSLRSGEKMIFWLSYSYYQYCNTYFDWQNDKEKFYSFQWKGYIGSTSNASNATISFYGISIGS